MKLEVGKTYITHAGKLAKVFSIDIHHADVYFIANHKEFPTLSHETDGRCSGTAPCWRSFDLIKEYVPKEEVKTLWD